MSTTQASLARSSGRMGDHPAPARKLPRASDLALVAIFLVAIATPLAGLVSGFPSPTVPGERTKTLPENRPRSWSDLVEFSTGLRQYFEGRWTGRARVVHTQAVLFTTIFGESPSDTVIYGRDGWLYYADDGGIEDYLSEKPLTPSELEAWKQALVRNRDWLQVRGIHYLFVLAPDKHQVYPEYMRAGFVRVNAEPRLDQLTRYLTTHSDLDVLDLRQPLLTARSQGRLYHRTDTHWDDLGAVIGYQQIVERVAQVLPVPPPRAVADFQQSTARSPGHDLAEMLGLESRLLETEDISLTPRFVPRARIIYPPNPSPYGIDEVSVTELPGSTLPRAVMFRDSFGTALMPLLSEHFSRVVYVWHNEFEPKLIERERPNIVIQEMVGRRLHNYEPAWLSYATDNDWVLPGQPRQSQP